MSRTRKAPLRGAKAVDRSCCNHGTCSWCRSNRTIQTKRARAAADAQVRGL